MLTLFHSPMSRSTRIMQLLHELDALDQVEIRQVTIPRQDGSGQVDPDNPHPEGKVPVLVHDGCIIRESNAIILYLTDLFPSALAPVVGAAGRGSYLSWLAYYGNVVEPVLVHHFAELSHPVLDSTFRGVPELKRQLENTLNSNDFLLGSEYSAADLLVASPFAWFPDLAPDVPSIQGWLKRCEARPSNAAAAAFDGQ
ncbi:glutathione S-transferase family protein [Granulosicoccus sp. 3-233]|uniref:glutathione S-transferase family protein n=1 Tax=Granulosicoccus sp. 3-233 TaxID=3417969 RepID=UPI003D33E9EC